VLHPIPSQKFGPAEGEKLPLPPPNVHFFFFAGFWKIGDMALNEFFMALGNFVGKNKAVQPP
jgi:hypothetical protein